MKCAGCSQYCADLVRLADMDSLLFSKITGCGTASIGIRCGQTDADPALVDLEPQTALLIIVGLLTQFREFGSVGKQPLF